MTIALKYLHARTAALLVFGSIFGLILGSYCKDVSPYESLNCDQILKGVQAKFQVHARHSETVQGDLKSDQTLRSVLMSCLDPSFKP